MPCYEPPRPDGHDYGEMTKQRDKYVACLKDIEELAQDVLQGRVPYATPPEMKAMANLIMDTIDAHFGKK